MPTEAFLQTFVLAAFALGSAVFVLFAVLPLILPTAIDAAIGRLEEIRGELPGLGSVETGRISAELERLTEKMDDLKTKLYSIDRILRIGGAAAACFIFGGLVALGILASYPYVDAVTRTAYYLDTWVNNVYEALFLVGLLLGLIFALMFSNLVSLILSRKPLAMLAELTKATVESPRQHGAASKRSTRVSEDSAPIPVPHEFRRVIEESRLLTPQSPELSVARWWPAATRLRANISATDTVNAKVLFYESGQELPPASISINQTTTIEERVGMRTWLYETETKPGVCFFVVRRPQTNWLNPMATIQVWESQPLQSSEKN